MEERIPAILEGGKNEFNVLTDVHAHKRRLMVMCTMLALQLLP